MPDTTDYAHLAQVLPIGLMKPYGDFPTVEPLRGTVTERDPALTTFTIEVDRTQSDLYRTIFTKALSDLDSTYAHANREGGYGRGQLWVRLVGSEIWTMYDYDWSNSIIWEPRTTQTTSVASVHGRSQKGLGQVPPALSAQVDFYVVSLIHGVSKQTPLLINDVHPVTLLRHLCEGRFGKLSPAGGPTHTEEKR